LAFGGGVGRSGFVVGGNVELGQLIAAGSESEHAALLLVEENLKVGAAGRGGKFLQGGEVGGALGLADDGELIAPGLDAEGGAERGAGLIDADGDFEIGGGGPRKLELEASERRQVEAAAEGGVTGLGAELAAFFSPGLPDFGSPSHGCEDP